MDADALAATARRMLLAQPYGFLTSAPSGAPSSAAPSLRLVQHVGVDDDVGVWIGTSPRSRKVREVTAHPAATYAVEDRAGFAYASFTGAVVVVDDPDERARRFAAGFEAFFPGGPGGDDFVLLHLRTVRIEVVHFVEGIHPDPYGLVPAVAVRRHGRWRTEPAERGDRSPDR